MAERADAVLLLPIVTASASIAFMTDWASLRHAYGSAADVPGLLAGALTEVDDRQVWDDLWSRLCHQGTVYSASYPALPALAGMASQLPAAGYVEPLALAAAIVASNDGPEDFRGVLRDYPGEIAALRDMAERNLDLADDDVEFVYALEALMSFEGASPWNRTLHVLADQEMTLECPRCGEQLTISFESMPPTTTALDDDLPITPVTPADAAQLYGAAARIQTLALNHGHGAVAKSVLDLSGSTICPACEVTVDLSATLGSADAASPGS
ncbi:MAG: hypothetical protein HY876_02475 [Coriobacteriales bacterium]|nr:hypothetical protein [Coriobacteriales bacterium]